jgi:hypothetical protein
MPVVPTYTPQVRTARTPDTQIRVNTSLETFGGGDVAARIGSAERAAIGAVDKFSEVAGNIYLQEKKKADTIRVDEGINKAIARRTMYTYGSENPEDNERGFVTRKGKDAFGVTDDYGSKYKKDLADIENEFSNGDQKQLFRQKARDLELSFNEQLSKHVAAESKAYEIDTIKSGISVSQDEAVKNFGDPLIIAQSLERQKELTNRFADLNGMSEDARKQALLEVTTQTHAGVIQRMLEGENDALAQTYFNATKSEISGKAVGNIEKALEESSLRANSQKAADEISAKTNDFSTAVNEVKKIKDAKLRDETMRRIKDEFDLKKAMKAQRDEQNYIGALNKLEASGGNLDKVNPGYFATLSLSERNGLMNYAKNLREGIPVSTDWGEYYNLKTMASSPNTKGEFLKLNLSQYRHKFGDTEFKEMVNLQTQMRKGDEPDGIKQFRSNKQIADQTLEAVGINPNPKDGTKDAKDVLEFNTIFGQKIDEHTRRTGQPPTNEEAQTYANELVMKGVTKEIAFWSDERKFKFQLKPTDAMFKVEDVTGIPPKRKREIEAYLKKYNRPVTDEAILEAYNRVIEIQLKQNK